MMVPLDTPDWRSMSQEDRDRGLNNGLAVPEGVDLFSGWERRSAELRARYPKHAGPEDPTIKPMAKPFTRRVAEPYDLTLASLATKLWKEKLPGKVWLMPMSHWHYISRKACRFGY